MQDGFEFLTVVTDENGVESEVYVDRSNGRVYVHHESGAYKATSVDVYGAIMNYDNDDFETILKGAENG